MLAVPPAALSTRRTSAPSITRLASSETLPWRKITSRKARPASNAAFPDTNVWRDADVLPQSGVRSVSPSISDRLWTGTPNASAAICEITVLAPCPISIAPWCRTQAPSAVTPIRMVDGFGRDVLPHPYQQLATPMPLRNIDPVLAASLLNLSARANAASHSGCNAAKQSAMPTPVGKHWPVTVGMLFCNAFIRRNASRSMSSFSANRS